MKWAWTWVAACATASAKVLAPPLRITRADRIIDLHHRVAKVHTAATFAFRGTPKPVHALVFTLPKKQAARSSQIDVSVKGEEGAFLAATPLPSHADPSHTHFLVYRPGSFDVERDPRVACMSASGLDRVLGCAYDNALPDSTPLMSDSRPTLSLTFSYFVGHAYSPMPRTVPLRGTPGVIFQETRFFQSPYTVEDQETRILMRGGQEVERIEGLTLSPSPPGGVSLRDYRAGPFSDVPPLFEPAATLSLHFAHKKHLAFMAKARKVVDVSDRGPVRIKESFTVINEAAALKGEYARQSIAEMLGTLMGRVRKPGHKVPDSHILFDMVAILPREVYNLDLYDAIGNVSSSNARRETSAAGDVAHVTFEPRYPVLGGWKSEWYLEYMVPFNSFIRPLLNESGVARQAQFALHLPVSPAFKSLWYDETEVEVLLPAGASGVNVHSTVVPREVVIREATRWLDRALSRKRVFLTFANIVVPEKQLLTNTFQISYRYSPVIALFGVPIWRVCLALIVIGVVRLLSSMSIDVRTPAEADFDRQRHDRDATCTSATDILEGIERNSSQCVLQMEKAMEGLKGDNQKARLHMIRHSWRQTVGIQTGKLKSILEVAPQSPDSDGAEAPTMTFESELLDMSKDWMSRIEELLDAMAEGGGDIPSLAADAERLRSGIWKALVSQGTLHRE